MAGTDDGHTKRLRELARVFDERGRKGTRVQEIVAELDKAERMKKKPPIGQPKNKEPQIEEGNDNG